MVIDRFVFFVFLLNQDWQEGGLTGRRTHTRLVSMARGGFDCGRCEKEKTRKKQKKAKRMALGPGAVFWVSPG